MYKYYQVKEFGVQHENGGIEQLNEFLKEKGNKVKSVTSFYNSILGGTCYVVLYGV